MDDTNKPHPVYEGRDTLGRFAPGNHQQWRDKKAAQYVRRLEVFNPDKKKIRKLIRQLEAIAEDPATSKAERLIAITALLRIVPPACIASAATDSAPPTPANPTECNHQEDNPT